MPKSCLSHAFWPSPIVNASAKIALSKSEPFTFASFFPCPCDSIFLICPLSSPNRFIGVLGKNSVNRYWVAMAPLHRKRPRQFVSSYSFARVAVLGRIILLLSPGLHSWHALRLRSGCSRLPGYTMLYTCLPLVSTCVPLVSYSPACRMMCLMCFNSTQQHCTGRDKKQRPSKERDQLQQTREKNYQNLNETLRARRCDTTSGHLVRRKPSGSSSEAIQQHFGSSQRQQHAATEQQPAIEQQFNSSC